MALWERVLQLPDMARKTIQEFYATNHMTIEVRHYLANYIEQEMLTFTHFENEYEFQNHAASFFEGLIRNLELKCNEPHPNNVNFTCKIRLNEAVETFKSNFAHNPVLLFNQLKKCIEYEKYIIGSPSNEASEQTNEVVRLNRNLQELMQMKRDNDFKYKDLAKDYEEFYLILHDYTKKQAMFEDPGQVLQPQDVAQNEARQVMEERKRNLDHKLNLITTKRLDLVDSFKNILHSTKYAQDRVLNNFLAHWKITQSKAGNGAMPMTISSLDTIQAWCEILSDVIWSTREAIRNVSKFKKQLGAEEPNLPDYLPVLHADVTNLLMNLITSTFVIEKQPPQVMKTNTRFASAVRLLIGNTLNIKMNSPVVKASIVSEAQAQIIQQTNKTSELGCGEIINNQGNMEYNDATKQLSVNFRNMQLKKIKRAEKKGTESVMDEKFALLFQSNFAVGHGDIVFSVWALSLPVVVIVHGNQEPQSWATITWDNAFADVSRVPFQVPDKVPWHLLADALNMKFKSATGKPLTPNNLHFLAEKAFRQLLPSPINEDLLISWAQFCKEPLPERNFTFWEWFYATMKLTREHLRGPWNDDSIIGFIHKPASEELLKKCENGTFLLRFSDSELGGITIAWMCDDKINNRDVLHIQPFTAKDFATRGLSDRIRDLDELIYLHPRKIKHEVFERYATPMNQPKSKDYIQSGIRAVLPTSSGTPHVSYPNTPSSFTVQSPDPSRDTASVHSAQSYAPLPEDNAFQMNEYEFDNMFI